MINISFIDRVKEIFETIINASETKIVLPVLIGLIIILILSTKIKNKVVKIIYSLIFALTIGVLVYYFQKPILEFVDYLVENIVNNILFPNLAIFIAMVLVVDFVTIISIINGKTELYKKNINISCFSIIQLLLFFIVRNVINNNINVYEQLSIYTNQELLVLIEASMIVFVTWLVVRGIIRITNSLAKNQVVVEDIKEESIYNNDMVLDINEVMDNNENEFMEYVPIKKKRV